MNVLITGGAGFSGGYIAQYLADRGCNVVATYRNSKPNIDTSKIKYVRQDISEEINIDGNFDVIIHTACLHPNKSEFIEDYIKNNVDSARQLVKYAKENNVKNIIYFSTKSVYGEIREKDILEENDIINQDMYGISKFLAEKVFQSATGINTIGFRTPGIIGPGAHDIWLVRIVELIKNNKDVTVSDYDTCNLVWIGDIAKFINKLIYEKKYKYNIVNLACSETINNLEIAEIVKNRFNSSSKITVDSKNSIMGGLNVQKAVDMGYQAELPRNIIKLYLDSINEN